MQTSHLEIARDTLLSPYSLTESSLETVFGDIMTHDADYADLYFQYSRSEGWSLEEGRVKSGSFNIDQGVGVRVVSGEKTAFAYSDDIRSEALIQSANQPIVFDADSLNILSENKTWLSFLPKNSVLTPHPKEFERLTQKAANDFERHQMQLDFSKKYQVYVLLKGAHSCLTTPDGQIYFNCTGNPGMATGGSGDVLTGILTGLLAQGMDGYGAACAAVWLHGEAANRCTRRTLMAEDLLAEIGFE